MNKRSGSKLILYFASIVFFIMLASSVLIVNALFLLYRFGHLRLFIPERKSLLPFAFLLFLSMAIGTFLAAFVARLILKPITKFSETAAKVAKGDFSVQLSEDSKIDEIREFSSNFNFMVRELSSIETLRNDFIANVSHEFKTPLASIEGYATLLQDEGLTSEEGREYAQMIIDGSRQLSTLVGNILLLSKLENHELTPKCVAYRLDEQLRQAVLLLETVWAGKGIDWDIHLPNVTYTGNKNLLLQVWMNLIGNAIKFSHPNGTIRIRMTTYRHTVNIEVDDGGCGMDEYVLRHAFVKFYQGDSSRTSDGNGLGLALVKRILDLCDGEVEVRSTVGQGSTFSVSLPLHGSERQS